MSGMWTHGRLPKVEAWFDRIQSRPSFQPAIDEWLPEHLATDMQTYGAQSWPDFAKILEIEH